MKFVFIGDVHGNLVHCSKVSEIYPQSELIQIGDLGVGFVAHQHMLMMLNAIPRFHFFVGNHDNRQLAKEYKQCLGDFGESFDGKFFFVSGADSIDKGRRTEGVNWWPDEELSYKQAELCLHEWTNSNSQVLVCHDIPQSFAEGYQLIYDKTLTRNLLQQMIEDRKPQLLLSGHHHVSRDIDVDGIRWKALGIDETFSIDI
jgi:hypothetical protein